MKTKITIFFLILCILLIIMGSYFYLSNSDQQFKKDTENFATENLNNVSETLKSKVSSNSEFTKNIERMEYFVSLELLDNFELNRVKVDLATGDGLKALLHFTQGSTTINSLIKNDYDRLYVDEIFAGVLTFQNERPLFLRGLKMYSDLVQNEKLDKTVRSRIGESLERLILGTNDKEYRKTLFQGPILGTLKVTDKESVDLYEYSKKIVDINPIARSTFFVAMYESAKLYEDWKKLSEEGKKVRYDRISNLIKLGKQDLLRQSDPTQPDNKRIYLAINMYGISLYILKNLGYKDIDNYQEVFNNTLSELYADKGLLPRTKDTYDGFLRMRYSLGLAMDGQTQKSAEIIKPVLAAPPVRYAGLFAAVKNLKKEGNKYEQDAIAKLEAVNPDFKKLLNSY